MYIYIYIYIRTHIPRGMRCRRSEDLFVTRMREASQVLRVLYIYIYTSICPSLSLYIYIYICIYIEREIDNDNSSNNNDNDYWKTVRLPACNLKNCPQRAIRGL